MIKTLISRLFRRQPKALQIEYSQKCEDCARYCNLIQNANADLAAYFREAFLQHVAREHGRTD